MKPIKIALLGEMRSGKDTVADIIRKNVYNMDRLYFAKGIKELIETYFPESFGECGTLKPRKHYQEIGQFMRTIDPDVWVNKLEQEYKESIKKGSNVIITDLRQINEYVWAKNNGFTVIKVDSDLKHRIERMENAGDVFDLSDLAHETESSIRNIPYDYIIGNYDTLESLETNTLNILKKGIL